MSSVPIAGGAESGAGAGGGGGAHAAGLGLAARSARGVPCPPVPDLPGFPDAPHLAEIGFFDVPPGYPEGIARSLPQPVLFEGVAPTPDFAPRALGADSRAVLREAGLDDSDIETLVSTGVVTAA